MGIAPTGSRSDLLLQCPHPFHPDLAIPPEEIKRSRDEARQWGLDFHAVMAKAPRAKKLPKGLVESAKAAQTVLERFLKGYGWGIGKTQLGIEQSFALNVNTGEARRCKPATEEDHIYPDQKPGELCMTLDIFSTPGNGRRRVLVLDHKTGADDEGKFARPGKLGQLLSGLAAASRAMGARGRLPVELTAATLHAPREGTPVVYADTVSLDAVRAHEDKLTVAFSQIGSGFTRTGSECRYCPAREVCPTRGSELLERADKMFGALATRQSEELYTGNDTQVVLDGDPTNGIEAWDAKLGRLYELVKLAEDAGKEIRKRLAEERRKGHLPVLSSGKVLDFRTKTYKNLSMSAMTRQIGVLAAKREFARLEKMGAIEEVTREELRPVDD